MRSVVLMMVLGVIAVLASEIKLTEKQAHYIAQKVWQNEGAGQDKYLVHWNEGEDFASVGIGHFIWFSKGHTERFREVFPMVLAYMEQEGVKNDRHWLNSKNPFDLGTTKRHFFMPKTPTANCMGSYLLF